MKEQDDPLRCTEWQLIASIAKRKLTVEGQQLQSTPCPWHQQRSFVCLQSVTVFMWGCMNEMHTWWVFVLTFSGRAAIVLLLLVIKKPDATLFHLTFLWPLRTCVQVCAYRKIRRIDSCQYGWIQADLRLMQINYANNVNIHILVLIILNSYYFTDKYQFTKCTLLHLFVNVVHKGTRLSVETSIVLL